MVGVSVFVAVLVLSSLVGHGAVISAVSPPTLERFRPYAGWEGRRVWGWVFSTDQELSVTALGYFDYLGDGLDAEHPIGIWALRGEAPLASATIGPGAAGVLHDGYRYLELQEALHIGPGAYILASLGGYDLDGYPADVRDSKIGQGIEFRAVRRASEHDIFAKPMQHVLNGRAPIDGSNFLYAVVPEPGLPILLLLGVGLCCRRSRDRSRQPFG